MTKLFPSFTYNEQIFQRLSVHLNNIFRSIKLLVSVLNLTLDLSCIVLENDDYIDERLIISGPESPIQCLSCIIETLLKPIVPHLITYIKDDWEFIKFLSRSLTFDSDMYSCYMGVCALQYLLNLV